jgi:hypothetical protein
MVSVREVYEEIWKSSCQFSVREHCVRRGDVRANNLYWERKVRARELDLKRSEIGTKIVGFRNLFKPS